MKLFLKSPWWGRIATLPLVLAAVSCTAPVSISTLRPEVPEGVSANQGPGDLIGQIAAVQEAAVRGDESAEWRYRFLVGRLIERLSEDGVNPWVAPVRLESGGVSYRVSGKAPAGVPTGIGQLTAVDSLKIRSDFGDPRGVIRGLGAPMVAASGYDGIGRSELRKNIPVRNVTAVVRVRGQRAEIELIDPFESETVMIQGRRARLAADYGAAMLVALSKSRIDKLGMARLLNPSKYDNTANLNFTQPYDPQKIPVLLVHGLDSTPATFAPLYFQLIEDPLIRRNYQFWLFSYPSGYPYHYSAALLRRELDEVKRDFPDHQGMIVMGHSMGGVISRLMVTDAGDRLWVKAFGKSPEETKVSGASRKLLEETLIFRSRREIDRVVFFSAPHRGSNLAINPVTRLFAKFIRMPSTLSDLRSTALSLATADQSALILQSAPNSIGTLSPKSPFVLAVNQIPITSRVPHHTVVGDRGRGDTPNSSDGIVSYWSAHLDSATSEKVVPSGHGSHSHPEGIEEARRILHLHLKSR
ncbi:MAG: alpha/beta hydrolase [Akkermansiaceae bacterium]|nr:alpha/beta hydrolase [Akkermansiaceae bacterium]